MSATRFAFSFCAASSFVFLFTAGWYLGAIVNKPEHGKVVALTGIGFAVLAVAFAILERKATP